MDVANDTLKHRRKKLKRNSPWIYVQQILIGLLVIAPFYILIITSITSFLESNYAEFHFWPQLGVTFDAYHDVLFSRVGNTTVLDGLKNTFLIYFPSVTVGVFTSAAAAYAFAKMRFRASKIMFSTLVFSMMFPNVMNMIASFMIFDTIGWVNTPLPLMVPRMLGTASAMFFLRQYYVSLPEDLINSAKIDGAGHWRIFWTIAIPVSMPVILAQWIFMFMDGYNEYTAALIYLQDARWFTVQLALAFMVDPYTQNWPLRMAGVVVSLVPMLMIYTVAQKYITQGMSITSGLKG